MVSHLKPKGNFKNMRTTARYPCPRLNKLVTLAVRGGTVMVNFNYAWIVAILLLIRFKVYTPYKATILAKLPKSLISPSILLYTGFSVSEHK